MDVQILIVAGNIGAVIQTRVFAAASILVAKGKDAGPDRVVFIDGCPEFDRNAGVGADEATRQHGITARAVQLQLRAIKGGGVGITRGRIVKRAVGTPDRVGKRRTARTVIETVAMGQGLGRCGQRPAETECGDQPDCDLV